MKKIFTKALLLAACVLTMSSFRAVAQQMPEMPVDENVRIGKLDNGLTYYIRHNETPKGQADFYIAQKVGSILEDESQRGLAHFLEHMCFNGTTHFPGNQLREWLETVGVKFGYNLNAYTSIDETVYNISSVPTERESVQDSCLLILHDWANDLTLDPEEIDKERGVIHEEWRRSMAGQMRIIENLLPKMFPNSRYGYRLPIGIMEVVDNFEPQVLRDYYETWYRPDQQGIVVVGDIDVDRIEAKIKEIFSDIEMPENAKEREYFPVDDNEGTIYAIGSDKEQTMSVAMLMFKNDAFPKEMKNSVAYIGFNYMTDMITSMLNNRLSEIASDPDAAFGRAYVNYGDFFIAKTKSALDLTVIGKGDDIRPAIEAAYRELLRAYRGGFTVSEYERARSEYLSRLETAYNNRENRESERYVREYVRHFIDNEPIPSIEFEYQVMNMLAAQLPVEQMNMVFKELISDNNRVFMCMLPEKEGVVIPTEDELKAVIAGVDAEELEPYVDEVKAEPLIPNLPQPGSIVSEQQNDALGYTEITLSNGIKVYVKQTKFKEDEILFNISAEGGSSVLSDDYANSLIFLPYAMGKYGLGTYTSSDLDKYLAGKQVRMYLSINDYARDLNGSTTPRDLKTAMEVIHMMFVDPTFDAKEFESSQKLYMGVLHNQEADPQYVFVKRFMESSYKSARQRYISSEIVENASRDQSVEILKKMTANPGDFKFIFVGNINLDEFRPLLEQYVATLPVDESKSLSNVEYRDDLMMVAGNTEESSSFKMETPQVWAYITMFGHMDYTAKNKYLASIAGEIIGKRFLNKVREEMGATYSIGARASLSLDGDPRANGEIMTIFPVNPEQSAEALAYIHQEFKDIVGSVTEKEVAEQVEFLVKDAKESLEKNDRLLNYLSTYLASGVDRQNGAVELLQSITVEDVQNFIKSIAEQGNYRVYTLTPEAE